jgi:hypothetical protein
MAHQGAVAAWTNGVWSVRHGSCRKGPSGAAVGTGLRLGMREARQHNMAQGTNERAAWPSLHLFLDLRLSLSMLAALYGVLFFACLYHELGKQLSALSDSGGCICSQVSENRDLCENRSKRKRERERKRTKRQKLADITAIRHRS